MAQSRPLLAAIVLVLLLPAGCGRPGQAGDPPAGDVAGGLWTVVPASATPFVGFERSGTPIFSAWRINNRTGALQFCSYDPGSTFVGAKTTPDKLSCSAAVKAAN